MTWSSSAGLTTSLPPFPLPTSSLPPASDQTPNSSLRHHVFLALWAATPRRVDHRAAVADGTCFGLEPTPDAALEAARALANYTENTTPNHGLSPANQDGVGCGPLCATVEGGVGADGASVPDAVRWAASHLGLPVGSLSPRALATHEPA